jgi:osmotically inducible protein OsmC
MPVRNARARWEGSLKSGAGYMELGSGAFKGPFTFDSRFKSAPETNPEELIGAAHAGCFSMAFAAELGDAGYNPVRVETSARVHLENTGDDFAITRINLVMRAEVPDIDQETFLELAEKAKTNCPVSRLLQGAEIQLEATLE